MKKTIALCALLLLPSQIMAAGPPAKEASTLKWSAKKTWKLSVKPVDFVQSLDNKLVFVLGEDSEVHIYTVDGVALGTIPVAKETMAIDIAPRGEMLYLINSDKTYTALDISFAQNIDTAGSPFLGKENAPISLVVFSDFQCPYCGKVQPLLEEMLEKNPDSLKIVFKHLPLKMHKQAGPAALASIAAHEQGKFWQMHDALFAIGKGMNKESIEKAALDVGLDMKKFNKDWNSPAGKKRLGQDMNSAAKAGVSGTPTLFINGRQVTGRGTDVLQKMIRQELADIKAKATK